MLVAFIYENDDIIFHNLIIRDRKGKQMSLGHFAFSLYARIHFLETQKNAKLC